MAVLRVHDRSVKRFAFTNPVVFPRTQEIQIGKGENKIVG
jgi:hypothetical protein